MTEPNLPQDLPAILFKVSGHDRLGSQAAALDGQTNTFAGERVDKPGCVASQKGANASQRLGPGVVRNRMAVEGHSLQGDAITRHDLPEFSLEPPALGCKAAMPTER